MNPEVFREYDVRGVVDSDLNPNFAHLLGRAVGTHAVRHGVRTMALGRDCRLSSEAYQDAIGRGITAAGVDVIDIGLCATPMLYFAIRHFGTDGGVMVTGSHNPPDYNGFKICIGPDTIYGEEIQELRRIIEGATYATGKGKSVRKEVAAAYEEYLFNNVRISPGLRIVLDGGNGVGGHFALPLLKRYGCRVTEIYCEPDGRFPHHFPDPTVPDNLRELIRLVREEKADAGIAYDGDADRIGVITDRGDVLWGDELLLLFSRFILKENPGATIIGEVKCSQKLYDDIAGNGGRGIMWKAGHSLIKGKMREENALLAGEMSGHIFFADRYFGYDDAIYASARLLEIISQSGRSLSALLADLPRTFTTPEIRVDCPDRIKFRVVEAVREHFRKTHDIISIDGVRIPFADGWGLLRASNTQPVLVLRFEAAAEDRLAAIRESMEEVLHTIVRSFD
ncbi:MAG: phosphomannomutase/phosphoglucomutase [Syntrophales bacterium]